MPQHSGRQQYGIDDRVNLGGRSRQVFHAGDRTVEQAVVDGNDYRPAVAHEPLQAKPASIQVCRNRTCHGFAPDAAMAFCPATFDGS